jgi:muramoyltetrapeptide carboxypeptidase
MVERESQPGGLVGPYGRTAQPHAAPGSSCSRRRFGRQSDPCVTSEGSCRGNARRVPERVTVRNVPYERVKPGRLSAGAVLGVVAPASPLYNRGDIPRAAAALETLGFRLKLGRHVRDQHGYLAGSDADRAADFMDVWCDPEVDGVICLRGGYGTTRIVDRLDFAALAERPKVFVGYSDATALHLALGSRAGLVTFYGPMIWTFSAPGLSAYTRNAFALAVTSLDALGVVAPNPDDAWVETIVPGTAEGELVGGCVSLLAGALGTRDAPDWRGKIVFLEDVGDEPYAIDAKLVQLVRAGAFDGVAGVVVAEHAGVEPRTFRPAYPSTLSFEDVIDEVLRPLGVPMIYNLPLGHGTHLATVPLGVRARLDADHGRLEILESGVS